MITLVEAPALEQVIADLDRQRADLSQRLAARNLAPHLSEPSQELLDDLQRCIDTHLIALEPTAGDDLLARVRPHLLAALHVASIEYRQFAGEELEVV